MARGYLGREDGRLFYEPWPKETDPWMPFEGIDRARAAPIFMRMFLTVNEEMESLKLKVERLEEEAKTAMATASDANARSLRGAKPGAFARALQTLGLKFLA
jgi:hypothetical protein